MNIALSVFEIVAPVFLLAGIGFTWVRLGFDYPVQFVTQLAMSFAVPCLIFVSLMQAEITPEALRNVSLAGIAAYGAVTVFMIVFVLLLHLDRRTFLSPLTFGNTGNIGLPLALFAFGPEGLSYAIVLFAIMAIWNFTYGLWLVSGRGSFHRVIRDPILLSSLLGGLFLWQGWQTPVALTNGLALVGQMAIPLMLLTLGVAVARLVPENVPKMLLLSAAKLVICIAIAWAVGRWFNLSHSAFGVLVLQVATPVAVTSYLLAEKYGADSKSVAGLVVVSTCLSTLTLPVLLAFLI